MVSDLLHKLEKELVSAFSNGKSLYGILQYRVIPSVLDPRKCEYLKEYSLLNLIFCKYILYL
jgi:hypothetical protein